MLQTISKCQREASTVTTLPENHHWNTVGDSKENIYLPVGITLTTEMRCFVGIFEGSELFVSGKTLQDLQGLLLRRTTSKVYTTQITINIYIKLIPMLFRTYILSSLCLCNPKQLELSETSEVPVALHSIRKCKLHCAWD